MRSVAIIISCNGSDDNAKKAIKGTLRENGKLILGLSNRDLANMLEYELNGNSASEYLYNGGISMKVFVDTDLMNQSAHFGWQDKDEALYGLREGYKNSTDELVEIAVNSEIILKYLILIFFRFSFLIDIAWKSL